MVEREEKKRQCRKLENSIVAQGKGTENLSCREKVNKKNSE